MRLVRLWPEHRTEHRAGTRVHTAQEFRFRSLRARARARRSRNRLRLWSRRPTCGLNSEPHAPLTDRRRLAVCLGRSRSLDRRGLSAARRRPPSPQHVHHPTVRQPETRQIQRIGQCVLTEWRLFLAVAIAAVVRGRDRHASNLSTEVLQGSGLHVLNHPARKCCRRRTVGRRRWNESYLGSPRPHRTQCDRAWRPARHRAHGWSHAPFGRDVAHECGTFLARRSGLAFAPCRVGAD